MKILVLNGSPKANTSNTMKLTNAFLEGFISTSPLNEKKIEIIDIAKANIQPCRGCYACWTSTPGKCCINDDMSAERAGLFEKYLDAELVIWSFPLYCYGMPPEIKAFMDRRLPVCLPYIAEKADGGAEHPLRFDISAQRNILISTCGFYTTENNYDALIKQFDIVFKESYEKILCPQGELFRVPELKGKTDDYLFIVKQAGAEYAEQGQISAETKQKLAEPLFPKEAFMEMANASWEIAETKNGESDSAQSGYSQNANNAQPVQSCSAGERLLRQMSAIYSPSPNAPKKEKIIEFFFTDTNETYQLQVKGDKSIFVKDTAEYKPYSVRIETPFTVWQDISSGTMDGKQALFQNKYRVLGEFDLMLTLMEGFSVRSQLTQRKKTQPLLNAKETAHLADAAHPADAAPKKRSMLILLSPFLALWILLPLFDSTGAFAAIFISACVPLLSRFFRLSPYDTASAFICSVLSIAFLAGVPSAIIVTLSYFLFGSLWLVSLFFHIPLCAWYSANKYNGDEAFDNPLFISTNRIVAAFWGILYLGVSVFTWFVMQSIYASLVGLFNSIAPAIAGLITAVFVKWYPAHFARRRRSA